MQNSKFSVKSNSSKICMLARGAKRGQRIGNKIRMDGVIGSSNKSNALSSINASK